MYYRPSIYQLNSQEREVEECTNYRGIGVINAVGNFRRLEHNKYLRRDTASYSRCLTFIRRKR